MEGDHAGHAHPVLAEDHVDLGVRIDQLMTDVHLGIERSLDHGERALLSTHHGVLEEVLTRLRAQPLLDDLIAPVSGLAEFVDQGVDGRTDRPHAGVQILDIGLAVPGKVAVAALDMELLTVIPAGLYRATRQTTGAASG